MPKIKAIKYTVNFTDGSKDTSVLHLTNLIDIISFKNRFNKWEAYNKFKKERANLLLYRIV